MKLVRITAVVGAIAAFGLALVASAGTIVGSKHDMNAVFGANTINNNEVCLPCHAPHQLPVDVVTGTKLGRLWNHTMPNKTYVLFGTGTSYATAMALPGGLDETSRKCLSCHDGSTAVDSYGAHTNGTQFIGGTSASAGYVIGGSATDGLKYDHPVGVAYPKPDATTGAWTSTSFRDPTTFTGSGAGSISYVDNSGNPIKTLGNRALSLKTVGTDKLVTCGSCHTPHNNDYQFMRISNVKSQLCLTCHVK